MELKLQRQYHKLKSVLGLSFSLSRAHIKLRNEGSYLGVLWYLLGPLGMFCIILFIKGTAFSHVEMAHYPLYLLIGLIIYNLFTKFISKSISVIERNGGLLKNIQFNSVALIISEILQLLFSHFFEFILLALCMIYFDVSLAGLIVYILFFPVFLVFLLGCSFLFATVGAYISDLGNVWNPISQLVFFVTPIFHILQPDTHLYMFNSYNPLYYFITVFRDAIIYNNFPSFSIVAIIVVISVVSFIIGLSVFSLHKKHFPELT
ncbi:MAG: ABC transporter permease [bacterium]|nr:ABC transporter permease [bacterium]